MNNEKKAVSLKQILCDVLDVSKCIYKLRMNLPEPDSLSEDNKLYVKALLLALEDIMLDVIIENLLLLDDEQPGIANKEEMKELIEHHMSIKKYINDAKEHKVKLVKKKK